jgi:hypothetical protein
VIRLALRVAVAVPVIIGQAIHDEIRWRRTSGRQPSESPFAEPGMSAWMATTLEDIARRGK